MSMWHWIALLALIGTPFVLIFLLIRAGVRSGVRSGMAAAERDRAKDSTDASP